MLRLVLLKLFAVARKVLKGREDIIVKFMCRRGNTTQPHLELATNKYTFQGKA